jgi:hypothetical protein
MQIFDTENKQEIADLMMAMVGMDSVAYIRPIAQSAHTAYAVCAADGTELAIYDCLETARLTAKCHNLQATVLH